MSVWSSSPYVVSSDMRLYSEPGIVLEWGGHRLVDNITDFVYNLLGGLYSLR